MRVQGVARGGAATPRSGTRGASAVGLGGREAWGSARREACGLGVPRGDPRRRVAGVLQLAASLRNRARQAVPQAPAPTGWAAAAAISSLTGSRVAVLAPNWLNFWLNFWLTPGRAGGARAGRGSWSGETRAAASSGRACGRGVTRGAEGWGRPGRFFAGGPRFLALDNVPAAEGGPRPAAAGGTRGVLEYAQPRGCIADPARGRQPRLTLGVGRRVPYGRERFFKGVALGPASRHDPEDAPLRLVDPPGRARGRPRGGDHVRGSRGDWRRAIGRRALESAARQGRRPSAAS